MLVSRTQGSSAYADYSAYSNDTHGTRKRARVKKSNPMLKASTGAVILVGMILVYLFQVSLVTGAGYRLLEAQNQLSAVKNQNKALSVEIARLKSLDRIENIARNELNMVTPKGASVLAVKSVSEGIENTTVSSEVPVENEEHVVTIVESIAMKQTAWKLFVDAFSRVTASWFGEILSYLI